jgi:hypothetical protein
MGIFNRSKSSKTTERGQSPSPQQFIRDEIDKIYGHRGPPTLVALIKDDHPGRAVWIAVPSWDSDHEIEQAMNVGNPPDLRARVADIDDAMPSLWIPIRDMFANGEVEEPVLQIGVSEDHEWLAWNLPFPEPSVPSISENSRIWKVER